MKLFLETFLQCDYIFNVILIYVQDKNMITQIRKISDSVFFKFFLMVLALSFILWGVGDIIRNGRSFVASVGDEKITFDEFNKHASQELEKLQALYGVRLTEEQLNSLSIRKAILDDLVSRKLIEIEAQNLGLVISDDTIYKRISSNSSYHNEHGVFDKEIFKKILQANGIVEKAFIDEYKKEIASAYLTDLFAVANFTNDEMAKLQASARSLTKDVIKFYVQPRDIVLKEVPTLKELETHYEKNKSDYVTDERRIYQIVKIDQKLTPSQSKITSEEVQEEYENNLSDYVVPEKRVFTNFVFENALKAEHFLKECEIKNFTKAKDCYFKNFAKAKRNMQMSGTFAELPKSLADDVFSLKKNEHSEVIKSDYGFHVIYLQEIQSEKVTPFEKVKSQIRDFLQKKKQEEEIYELVKQVEDEAASGALMAEIVEKFSLKKPKTQVLNSGKLKESGDVALNNFIMGLKSSEVAVYSDLEPGTDSGDAESSNSQFYLISMQDIEPSQIKPFESVKPEVINSWTQEQKKIKAREMLVEIKRDVRFDNYEKILSHYDFVKFEKLKVSLENKNKLAEMQPFVESFIGLNESEKSEIFKNPKNMFFVLVGQSHLPENVSTDKIEENRMILGNAYENDFYNMYIQFLKTRYKIKSYL